MSVVEAETEEVEVAQWPDEEEDNQVWAPKEVVETPAGVMLTTTFNIEWLRFWGLIAGSVLLITGTIVTNHFVEYPEGSGGFDYKATFIYEIFHFNHTCTVLDFNPSRTVSGLVMMLHTIPMDLFIVLSYYRAKHDYASEEIHKWLWYYYKITTPFNFIAMTYFYMVFVNPPMDMDSFILHYIPYMLWQIAMVLMAIGQCAYISQMDVTPFNIPKLALRIYLFIVVLTGIYYTIFVWSFIGRSPILNTEITSSRNFAVCLMYFFDFQVAIIPTIFAFNEAKNGNTQTIQFFNTD